MTEPKKSITTIFFDIGGVLVSSFSEEFYKFASKTLKIKKKQLKTLIEETQELLYKGEVKARNPDQQHIDYWNDVLKIAKKRNFLPMDGLLPSRKVLSTLWTQPFLENARLYKDMLKLLKKLKETNNYNIFTLSDTLEPHFKIINRLFGRNFNKLFDGHVLSYKVHVMKPYSEIYKIALKKAHCKPQEALFIDDSIENIKGANKLGINTILHIEGNAQNTKDKLRQFGINWNETDS